MADSSSDPPLTHRLVGGLQWAVTGSYLFLLGVAAWAWYLRRTRTPAALDLTLPFAVVLLVAFAAGLVWVGARSPDAEAHARRIEVVVTLLVLGFAFPFAVPRLLAVVGATPQGVGGSLPLFGFGVAYALALAVSYGLVYALGTRFFLGSDPAMVRE
ncbi:hypothetical protein [Halorussus litoreus]|uniref:hypothetical protein n=1 Tax=Halorussus litoreus TaxID=1710536 RepID=UPI000E271B95|nr:hypothetical protein [Halorussus litoreus]